MANFIHKNNTLQRKASLSISLHPNPTSLSQRDFTISSLTSLIYGGAFDWGKSVRGALQGIAVL